MDAVRVPHKCDQVVRTYVQPCYSQHVILSMVRGQSVVQCNSARANLERELNLDLVKIGHRSDPTVHATNTGCLLATYSTAKLFPHILPQYVLFPA